MKVLETAVGAVFAPTRFSLVRISIRDLVADGKSLVRNSGVGGGGENLILMWGYPVKHRLTKMLKTRLRKRSGQFFKVARLQSEFCTKDFFLSYEFSYENCPEISPGNFEPLFCGSEKILQNSRQNSHQIAQISLRKIKK